MILALLRFYYAAWATASCYLLRFPVKETSGEEMKEVYGKNTDLDWARIAHLFKIGIISSLLALIGGDMILGWLSFGSLVTFTGLLINMPKAIRGGER